jgi:hypothetical protein
MRTLQPPLNLAAASPRAAVVAWMSAYQTLLRCPALAAADRDSLLAGYAAAKRTMAAVLLVRPERRYSDHSGVYSLQDDPDGGGPYPIWQPPLAAPVARAG